MAKRGHSEEEILRVLREAESGDSNALLLSALGLLTSGRFTAILATLRIQTVGAAFNLAGVGRCYYQTRSRQGVPKDGGRI